MIRAGAAQCDLGMVEWNRRHSSQIHHIQHVNDIPKLRTGHYVIHTGTPHLPPLEVMWFPRRSKRIIVALHGGIDRAKYVVPRFEWKATIASRQESLLFVADPLLPVAPDIRVAWYTGSAAYPAAPFIARVVDAFTVANDVTGSVIFGFSGGGFGALAVASYSSNAAAIAFSPQTDIARHRPERVRKYVDVVHGGEPSFDAAASTLPELTSLVERYRHLTREVPFWYVQNTGDHFHMENHFEPFYRAHSQLQGAEFVLAYEGAGHLVPNRAAVWRRLDQAFAVVDNEGRV